MKKVRYQQIYDGEKRAMVYRDLMSMCCDCGLVHLFRFRLARQGERTVIIKQTWRQNRATAAARRGKRYKGLRLPKP